MYKVILVDDEPVTFKSIRRVMEKQCQDFQIVEAANNGLDGLEAARKWKPDVVITDVEMPVMNGIELAKCIREELPDTLVVILSGYQEFEYAREALVYGVSEYLLKPIVPVRLCKTMEKMGKYLEDLYWKKRNQMMRVICQGGLPKTDEVQKYFGNKNYYMMLIRKNGLPKRFSMNQKYELFSIKQEQMVMYGRDVQEGLYLYSEELISEPSFRFYVDKMFHKYEDGASYITIVASERCFQIQEAAERIQMLYRILAQRTIIGKNQIIFLENLQDIKEEKKKEKKEYFSDILRFLKTKKYEFVLDGVKKLLKEWSEQEKTQLWMEGKVRQLFYILVSEGYLEAKTEDIEFDMEEVFLYATSMAELEENILSIIEKKRTGDEGKELRLDTPEYFHKIRAYIWENMAEPLTLQQICRQFCVSQPYISRFFRKYEGLSFSNYLTEIRIKKAKELFEQNRNLLIRDVAFMVGYNDQFYFSRIFRSVVGVTPTEFISQVDRNPTPISGE